MVLELLIIGGVIIVVFAPYMHAKADELRERVRQMEIENDLKEDARYEDRNQDV